jgi:hypothetical protein
MWVVQGFMEYCSFKYYLALQAFHSHQVGWSSRRKQPGRLGQSPDGRTARTIGTIARRKKGQD